MDDLIDMERKLIREKKAAKLNRNKQPNPTGRPLPSRFAKDFYVAFRTAKTPVGFIRVGLNHPPGTILTDAYSQRYQVKRSGALEAIA